MLIDTHCHLDDEKFENLNDIIERAIENNVRKIITVATNLIEWEKALQIANKYDEVYVALGIHPYFPEEVKDIKKTAFESKKVVAIGECGLDYAGENWMTKKEQKIAFVEQINLARELNLPVVIHTRDADEDMKEILISEWKNQEFKAVLHSYTSSWDLLKNGLDLGFFVSASGIITFKNAIDVADNFVKAPIERIVVETDGPWLAPVPFRGKICEPFMVKYTFEKLAEIKNIEFDELEKQLKKNSFELFGI